MTNNVEELATYLQPYLERLSVGERAKLSKQIGRDLRKNQSKRISAQQNPDGSTYTPRRKRLREQKGKIKRKMFTKLKNTARGHNTLWSGGCYARASMFPRLHARTKCRARL